MISCLTQHWTKLFIVMFAMSNLSRPLWMITSVTKVNFKAWLWTTMASWLSHWHLILSSRILSRRSSLRKAVLLEKEDQQPRAMLQLTTIIFLVKHSLVSSVTNSSAIWSSFLTILTSMKFKIMFLAEVTTGMNVQYPHYLRTDNKKNKNLMPSLEVNDKDSQIIIILQLKVSFKDSKMR